MITGVNRHRRRLAAALACLALVPLTGRAVVGGAMLPDLLEAPAAVDVRAQQSPQLAVARAGERLVGVGVRGIVLLSDDQGRSWRQASSVPVSVALTAVFFATPLNGWAVGHSGVILHTRDGGEHWQLQVDGRQAAQLILAEAQQRAQDAEPDDPAVRRGLRDAERLVEDGPDKPFLSVRFLDERRGFAVGAYGIALMTEDGGEHWQAVTGRIPNSRAVHLYSLELSGNDLLIAGEQGALFHSGDGGLSFDEISTPYPGTFFGVLALDRETLLAYGLRGNVWRSEDAGLSWVQVELGQSVTVTSGCVLSDQSIVLADESGRLLRSTDAGRSFVTVGAGFPTGLSALLEIDNNALLLAGARGLSRVEAAQLVVEAK